MLELLAFLAKATTAFNEIAPFIQMASIAVGPSNPGMTQLAQKMAAVAPFVDHVDAVASAMPNKPSGAEKAAMFAGTMQLVHAGMQASGADVPAFDALMSGIQDGVTVYCAQKNNAKPVSSSLNLVMGS